VGDQRVERGEPCVIVARAAIANSRAIRASVGAPLDWDSPFGPLRVDYAYPIAKQSSM
jgi:outer membrane protein insertion porin family